MKKFKKYTKTIKYEILDDRNYDSQGLLKQINNES